MLDEPANGLDPEGIAWLRDFMRVVLRPVRAAAVLQPSHLLEMAQTIDNAVINAFGQLKAQGTLGRDLRRASPAAGSCGPHTPEADTLGTGWRQAHTGRHPPTVGLGDDEVAMDEVTPEQVGPLLASNQIVLYSIGPRRAATSSPVFLLVLTAGLGFGDVAPTRRSTPLRRTARAMRSMPGVWVTFALAFTPLTVLIVL